MKHVCLDFATTDEHGTYCAVCEDRLHWSDMVPAHVRGDATREQMDVAYDRLVVPGLDGMEDSLGAA